MQLVPNNEDPIRLGIRLLETGEKCHAKGLYEASSQYLWEALSLFCSVSRSPIDPTVQSQIEPWIKKAIESLKTAKTKLWELRGSIPKLPNNSNETRNVILDPSCVLLYKQIAEGYGKEAEGEVRKHLLQASLNAHIIQCELGTKLVRLLTDTAAIDALKKEVGNTLKL